MVPSRHLPTFFDPKFGGTLFLIQGPWVLNDGYQSVLVMINGGLATKKRNLGVL